MSMTKSDLTTHTSGNADQYSTRSRKVDRIILHHCASTSLSGVLKMMSTGSREVSANYVIGNNGEIVSVVPEEYRAWTSGSAEWDGRAITFEIVNESAAPDWRVSDAACAAFAAMLADIAKRYGIVLSRETVITHQELHQRYGASYATACPGPYLQNRVGDIMKVAGTSSPAEESEEEDDDMWKPTVHLRVTDKGKFVEGTLAHPQIGLDLKPGQSRVEKTSAGEANVYRGFKASADEAVVAGWQAAYAKGPSTASSAGAKSREAYLNMQAAQTQMSVDLYGLVPVKVG